MKTDTGMVRQKTNQLLNSVLISMSRSFLQYVSESSPWVRGDAASVGREVEVLAARQHVAVIAQFLDQRESFVDFGSFPTEYTDLQFLALNSLLAGLVRSQRGNCENLQRALLNEAITEDAEAERLLTQVLGYEQDLLKSLGDLAAANAA
jgi:hypothetical protein